MSLRDELDTAIAEYTDKVGEQPALVYLCEKHFTQLNLEQRTWSAARRYGRGVAVGTTLNNKPRCLLCNTGIYGLHYPCTMQGGERV